MKIIEVKTSSEAYRLASDKDFNGIILHVKGE